MSSSSDMSESKSFESVSVSGSSSWSSELDESQVSSVSELLLDSACSAAEPAGLCCRMGMICSVRSPDEERSVVANKA